MYRDSVQEKLCLQNEGQVKRMTTLSVYSLQSLNFIKFVFFSQLKKKNPEKYIKQDSHSASKIQHVSKTRRKAPTILTVDISGWLNWYITALLYTVFMTFVIRKWIPNALYTTAGYVTSSTLKADWKGLISNSSFSILPFIPGYIMFPPVRKTFWTSTSWTSFEYLGERRFFLVQTYQRRIRGQCQCRNIRSWHKTENISPKSVFKKNFQGHLRGSVH